MKIGILGGAFNPPHIGHLVIAQEVFEFLKLDKIFFITSNISPHKESNEVEAKKRLEMVRLSISDNEDFKVKDYEVVRGGISYTVDTLKILKKDYPNDELYLIVGSDLADAFSTWKDFSEIKKLAKIVVAIRETSPINDKDDFILVKITQVKVSSSYIRGLIKKGRCIKHLVKGKVAEYIKKHNLYI